jgi:hypothetical protein
MINMIKRYRFFLFLVTIDLVLLRAAPGIGRKSISWRC